MFRAGLVCLLFIFYCFGVASSAPVPHVQLSSASSSVGHLHQKLSVDASLQYQGGVNVDAREFVWPELSKRDPSSEVETLTLERRSHIGDKIKHAFQKVGHAIKSGFQKAGRAIKSAAQKVGHFVKTTGAKIAKFGLKIISTAQSLASHVVRFIPGIGQAASAALKAESAGLNKASESIHVSLGKKLDKGMKVMSAMSDPEGTAAHAIANKMHHHH